MNFEIFHLDSKDLTLTDPVKLIYLDPPYGSKQEDEYYGIGQTLEDYLDYMKERLQKLKTLMDPKGSNILIHVDWKAVHYLKVLCDSVFGRNNFQNEIIWCFSNPSVSKKHLPRKHQNILWYGLGNYPCNLPRTEYTAPLKVGGNTSWSKKSLDDKSYLAKGKLLEDWWSDIPYLCRNEKEKTGYATQKPVKLMERIINTFSNLGDRILDPFMGSGSFLEMGIKLNRYAIGCDISDKAIEIARKRLTPPDLVKK